MWQVLFCVCFAWDSGGSCTFLWGFFINLGSSLRLRSCYSALLMPLKKQEPAVKRQNA